ncbi:hypothetical protein FE257_012020 [Aspergillus nanangensis]|uniref:BZIP domain-containing protein n=1 Tax=Aspergillus nanangensis TaxID=2582783 RepID=A0AAD4CGI7_ASPNN|nr:hypothetical protein FE257_012020 [Aspergillus nanangensis]
MCALHGLPTPDQNNHTPQTEDLQDTLDSLNYQSFDPNNFRFQNPAATASIVPPHSPPESFSKHSVSSNDVTNPHDPTSVDGEDQLGDHGMGRSSSEEKEGSNMTPAQTKRKAQNRAAQRAFRERKERHVRDLEEKLNTMQEASTTLMADNERLKQELAKFTTENEILRATSGSFQQSNQGAADAAPTMTGPLRYSPTDFCSKLVPKGEPIRRHRIAFCEQTGEKLLDAGSTWDLIQKHDLFKRGLVDIGDVADRLKGMAQCDGQGPAFRESQVHHAIEESAAANRDELI